MTRLRASAAALALSPLLLVSCSDGDNPPTLTGDSIVEDTTPVTDIVDGEIPENMIVRAGQPFPADRCAANQAAGTITYLSSFDFAATASIVNVLVAEEKGYFDELCLDVEIKASFSTANYPLIAANEAQFSSGGSFSEVVDFAQRNEAQFVILSVEGRTGIDALIVKPGEIETLADLRDTTIGVKGAITPSVAVMLFQEEGMVEGVDYQTVPIDGFDPKVHIEIPDIVGFPGYKSNEPQQLEAADIPFELYDPADYDIPGTFGLIYTNGTFRETHPTATEDFMRATMRGLADALADPAEASGIALDRINESGNAMFLSPEGETARWEVESALILEGVTAALPPGVLSPPLLQREVDTYSASGIFEGIIPVIDTIIDADLLADLYGSDGVIIWPAA